MHNEPAFPNDNADYLGLTKREYFAAAALQGMLANPEYDGSPAETANAAAIDADALIAELAKENL